MQETTVEIHGIKNASKDEIKAFKAACRQIEIEINSDGFWYEVAMRYISWSCKRELPEYRYAEENFAQFKTRFLSGSDSFNEEADHDIDVCVSFYYSFRSVVGYTTPSTWFTWINRNIFKGFDIGDIAGNIVHEYLHNMGLGHPGTDRNSVVYQMGYLIRERIKARLGLDEIQIVYKRSLWSRVKRFFSWRK